MWLELSTDAAARMLVQDPYAPWTYDGAYALIEFLEEIDPELELDVVGLRCQWAEYDCALDAAKDYDWTLDDADVLPTNLDDEAREAWMEAQALHWLERKTTVIQARNGNVIVEAW